jgi:hypothetical protein
MWHTSHVSMSSLVTSAGHVTLGLRALGGFILEFIESFELRTSKLLYLPRSTWYIYQQLRWWHVAPRVILILVLLATFLASGLRVFRSTSGAKNARTQHTEEVLFGLKIKRAGIAFFSGKDPATEQNNG